MANGRINIFGRPGSYRWNLKSRNGRVLAHGSGLNTKQGLLKSLRAIRKEFKELEDDDLRRIVYGDDVDG